MHPSIDLDTLSNLVFNVTALYRLEFPLANFQKVAKNSTHPSAKQSKQIFIT